jgi:hypothetical protein
MHDKQEHTTSKLDAHKAELALLEEKITLAKKNTPTPRLFKTKKTSNPTLDKMLAEKHDLEEAIALESAQILLLRNKETQQAIQQMQEKINENAEHLDHKKTKKAALIYAGAVASGAITVDEQGLKISHVHLDLIKNEVDETKATLYGLTHQHWFFIFLDAILSFLSMDQTKIEKAEMAHQWKKDTYDQLLSYLFDTLETTKSEIKTLQSDANILEHELEVLPSLKTLKTEQEHLESTIAFQESHTKHALMERCSLEVPLTDENQTPNQIKQALLGFLTTPSKVTLKRLKSTLTLKTYPAPLANLLYDVGAAYPQVHALLPKEKLLSINTQMMLGLLSEKIKKTELIIEKLRLKKTMLDQFIESKQDYAEKINQNSVALIKAYRVLCAIKRLELTAPRLTPQDVEPLKISRLAVEKKIKALQENLPLKTQQSITDFFESIDLKKHDLNTIFLVQNYALDSENFYRILEPYAAQIVDKSILMPPMTLDKMQNLKLELGSALWAEITLKISKLPLIKKAFDAHKEIEIADIISAMIYEQHISLTESERSVLNEAVPHHVIAQDILCTPDFSRQFFHKEGLQFLTEQRIQTLTKEHAKLVAYQAKSTPKKLDPDFYSYSLEKLSITSRNLSEQHRDISIALMAFLHHPAERLYSAFKETVKKHTGDTTPPDIALLVEYIEQFYETQPSSQLSLK